MNKHNIAATAIYMLEDNQFPLNMNMYQFIGPYEGDEISGEQQVIPAEDFHECGTACCFVGFAPLAVNDVKQYETWDGYSFRILGLCRDYEGDREIEVFLTDANWPNDKLQAAARALYALLHEAAPEDYNSYGEDATRFYENLNKKEIIGLLKVFL